MDLQYAYFAVFKILRDLGFTQKMLSEELKKKGIVGYSEGNLSRGKPKYHQKKKVWRRGNLPDRQLEVLLKGLNALLLEQGIEMRMENETPVWYNQATKAIVKVPTLKFEEKGHATTDESDVVQASQQQTEHSLNEKLKTLLPNDGALAMTIATHLEKGGAVEIVVIHLNPGSPFSQTVRTTLA